MAEKFLTQKTMHSGGARARVCLTNTKRDQMDSRESAFSVFACGQVATLGGSGALEMIVDRTEKTLGQKEPSLTSPSLL